MLTTKAGLAQSLKDYAASSGVNVDSFFPRCHLEFVWPTAHDWKIWTPIKPVEWHFLTIVKL